MTLRVKRRQSAPSFFYLLIYFCPCASVPISPHTGLLLPTARAELYLFSYFFFHTVPLKAAESPFHIPNGSLMCLSGAPRRGGGAACHRPLLSPQRLATLSRGPLTDLCWLTNQELNTANLCRGPPSPKCVLCFSHWARQMIGDSVAQGSPSPCNHSSLDRCCTPL